MQKTRLIAPLFVLVSLLLIGQSVATHEQILAEVSQTSKFGQALSALVQMTNQADSSANPSGRVNEIDRLLMQIKSSIEEQQAVADEKQEQSDLQCFKDISGFESQESELESQLSQGQREQDELNEELKNKNEELSNQRSSIAEEQGDLEEYNQQLTASNEVFAENSAQFEEAIEACEEAIRLLTDLSRSRSSSTVSFVQNGVVFVQLSQKFQNIKDILEKGVSKTQNAFVQPIIDVLMELGSSTKIDLAAVQQIIDLINTLLARLREGLHEHQVQHTTSVDGLTSLISDLSEQLVVHQSQVVIAQERIDYINSRLEQLSNVLSTTQELSNQITSLRDSTSANCEQSKADYLTQQNLRTSQLATLDRLINYFSEYVVSSTASVRDSAFD